MKKRFVLLIIILEMCLTVLTGCGASKEENTGSTAEVIALEAAQQVQPETGELRYSGKSSADNIGSIAVSFVLSEDKSNIRNFTIAIDDFQGSARIEGATVTVEISGSTQTVMGEIPVDYEGDNKDISVGDSTIESLHFKDDGKADMVFTYCFKQYSPNAYEIPVPGIQFELASEPAPAQE